MKLSLVVPCYNEAGNVAAFQDTVITAFEGCGYDYEIIFIDDGSKDKSVQMVKEIIAEDNNVHLIVFRKNFGKAAALQAGFRNATGDIVITMDADLQDDPKEIPRMIEKLDEEDNPVIMIVKMKK